MEQKKIYIADDDPDILYVLKLILQTRNYTVCTTTNANDIFDPDGFLPDLILLDIWMSGIDGREILKQIKQEQRLSHIPVLFISANSRLDEIAAETGADGFISKPFEMNFILQKVQEVLAQ